VPSQFFDALVIVFLHELLVLVLIVQAHDALQQFIGELQLTHLIHQVLADIEQEFVVAVGSELYTDSLFHLGAEFFFGLHYILTEHLIEDFLVQFARHEAGNFIHLEAEVRLQFTGTFLVDFEQRSQFGSVAVPSSMGVEHEHVVHLGIGKDSLLVVVLHIRRHHNGVFHLDAILLHGAVVVEFGQQTFQHVIVCIHIYALILTVTLGVHFDLSVHHFVGHLNVIVVHLIFLRHFHLEFGCQGDVEYELKIFLRVEVNGFLVFFIGKRFSQHIHLIILYIFVDGFRKQFIHFLSQYRLAIHFLYQADGNHPLAETRHLHLTTEILQCLVYFFLVISLFKLHSKQCAYVVLVL